MQCVSLIILYIPGCLALRAVRRHKSYVVAPIISLFIILLLAPLCTLAGIPCNIYSRAIFPSILTIAVIPIRHFCAQRGTRNTLSSDFRARFFHCIIQVALLRTLHSFFACNFAVDNQATRRPPVLVEGYDTVFHIKLARAFTDTGSFSALHASLYLRANPNSLPVNYNSGFYSAAWRCLATPLIQSTGCALPTTVSSLNLAMIVGLFAPACWTLLTHIFDRDTISVISGAVVFIGFLAFLWHILERGEQLP